MKDIVENRSRVGLRRKWQIARVALRENGLLWCICLLIYYFASAVAHRAFRALDRMRRDRNMIEKQKARTLFKMFHYLNAANICKTAGSYLRSPIDAAPEIPARHTAVRMPASRDAQHFCSIR